MGGVHASKGGVHLSVPKFYRSCAAFEHRGTSLPGLPAGARTLASIAHFQRRSDSALNGLDVS